MGFCDLEGAAPRCYSQQDERFELGGIFIGVQAERKRAPFALEEQRAPGPAFEERFVGLRRQAGQLLPGAVDVVDDAEDHAILR